MRFRILVGWNWTARLRSNQPDSALVSSHATIRGSNKQGEAMCWSHMLGRPGPPTLPLAASLSPLPPREMFVILSHCAFALCPLLLRLGPALAPHLDAVPPWLFLLYIASTPVLSACAKANTGPHKSPLWSFLQEPIPTFCPSQYLIAMPVCQSVRPRLHSCGGGSVGIGCKELYD